MQDRNETPTAMPMFSVTADSTLPSPSESDVTWYRKYNMTDIYGEIHTARFEQDTSGKFQPSTLYLWLVPQNCMWYNYCDGDRSWKCKMAAAKPEVVITQFRGKASTKFQVLYVCFRVRSTHWSIVRQRGLPTDTENFKLGADKPVYRLPFWNFQCRSAAHVVALCTSESSELENIRIELGISLIPYSWTEL
jgi:hypothetical protein